MDEQRDMYTGYSAQQSSNLMLSASETPLTSHLVSSKSSSVPRILSHRPVAKINDPSYVSSFNPSHQQSIDPSSLDMNPGPS